MKVSHATLMMTVDPKVRNILEGLIVNGTRASLSAVTAAVDNSTGVAGAVLAPVDLPAAHAFVGGATLALRTSYVTASEKVDSAVAVLAKHLSDNGASKTDLGVIVASATGTVTTPGTVPALDKVVTGDAGATAVALKVSDAAASLSVHRNNLATLARAYNALAISLGVATLQDNTGGKASQSFVVVDEVVPSAGVTAASGTAASKASVDAALTAIANNVATLAAKINATLFHANTLTGRSKITLVP